jgi:hypothetical protein
MQSQFDPLRQAFLPNETDMKRFRQLVVNSVMATDLFDCNWKQLRENRWYKKFHDGNNSSENNLNSIDQEEDSNRCATIIIEHIIQASDVS